MAKHVKKKNLEWNNKQAIFRKHREAHVNINMKNGRCYKLILRWWYWFSHNREKCGDEWEDEPSNNVIYDSVFRKQKIILISLEILSTFTSSFIFCKFRHNLIQVKEDCLLVSLPIFMKLCSSPERLILQLHLNFSWWKPRETFYHSIIYAF